MSQTCDETHEVKRTEKNLFEPPLTSFTLSFGINLAKFRTYFIIFVSELSSAVRFMRTNMNLPATYDEIN